MTTEASLSQGLVSHLKQEFPEAIIFRHEDQFTAGIPDISFTWGGVLWSGTTWLETKHVTPKKSIRATKSFPLQEQIGIELSCWTNARFIVFEERKIGVKDFDKPILSNMTYIAHPGIIEEFRNGLSAEGFSYVFVADYLRKIYGG